MRAAFTAGAAYFALVFALGFVLGVLRVTLLAPHLGVALATAIELPFILLAAWLICGWLLRRFALGPGWSGPALMGASALVLLLAAETLLGTVGFGRSLSEQLALYRETGPALGLVAQIAFAGFPLLQRRRGAADRR